MNSIKEQSLSGFKWSALGQFSTQGVHFVLGLMIARLLMPEDYGVIAMLSIFMAIAQSFVDCGFGNALIRKIDRTEVDCSTAFYFNIAIGVICYGVLFLTAPYIARFYKMPLLTEVVRIFSLVIFINSMGIVPRALRSIAVDFKSQAYASVFAAIVSGLIGLVMAYSGYGVWALVWQAVINAFLSVIVIWFLARWMPSWTYSWQSFRTMFSYGSKLLASKLLHTVYRHASTLVIGKFYTAPELGFYDRGFQVASFPSLKLSNVLNRVTFPILAKLQEDNIRLIHAYHQYMAMISLVIFFLMTLLAAVAKPLIVLLLTEKWAGSVPFLQVFCLAFMFDCICNLNNNLLFVKGWSGLFLKLEIIKKVIITPVFLIAIQLGVIAICVVAVIHTFVDILCSSYYIRKLVGVEASQFVCLFKYFLLSVLACLPAYLIGNIGLSPWVSLPTGAVVASVLYWGLLHRDEYMKECLQLVWNMIPMRR